MVEEGDQGERTLRREPVYWLIEKIEDGATEMLTVGLQGGQQALSIFSHREEAEMFLWLGRLTDSWRAKMGRGKEVVRVLSAPRASIGFVVLDPLPQMLDEHKVDLMSLTRDRFTSRLMGPPEDTSERRVGESTEPMRDGGYRAPLP